LATVALVGLGAIGSGIAAHLIERGHDLKAVVDSDPALAGRTLRELRGLNSDVRVVATIDEAKLDGVQVVVFATRSRLAQLAGDIERVLASGASVVSTCEELAFPWYADVDAALKIDAVAKERGAAVVGVGVNPGFVMDWVPALVASASKNPTSIHVVRSVDTGRRRKQLQGKTGVGLTKARFEKELAEGGLGHVGLVESASLIARSLGKELEGLRKGTYPVLGSGDYVMGVRQFAEGRAGDCAIRLDLEMSMTSADFDVVEVKGDPNVKMRFEGGVFGDSATEALAVRAVERIGLARRGLITVLDLPLTRT
jgi:hypothetical protein